MRATCFYCGQTPSEWTPTIAVHAGEQGQREFCVGCAMELNARLTGGLREAHRTFRELARPSTPEPTTTDVSQAMGG